tara:strand:- start:299 stop:631 length:333 start_codon:yes stop_codon:yes gene_type:complete
VNLANEVTLEHSDAVLVNGKKGKLLIWPGRAKDICAGVLPVGILQPAGLVPLCVKEAWKAHAGKAPSFGTLGNRFLEVIVVAVVGVETGVVPPHLLDLLVVDGEAGKRDG